MATFIPCPGIAEAVVETAISGGDIAVSKFYIYGGVDTAWTEASLTNLANTIDTWLETGGGAGEKYVDQMNTGYQVQSIHMRDLTTATSLEYVKAVAHSGTDATASLPSGLTKACTLRTGRAGRSFRGRTFMPGMTEAFYLAGDHNYVDPTKLSNLVAMWSSLITAIPAGDASWTWSVLSRFSGVDPTTKRPIPRATGVHTPIIEVGYSHQAFDYQRRRAPFHARHG